MKRIPKLTALTILLGGIAFVAGKVQAGDTFEKNFHPEKSELSSTGSSTYFVLEPGFTSVFKGQEKGKATVLTITVTKETKVVDGVKTRVVEEKETADGELVEISHNYFAISKKSWDVYYFGEDTEEYEHGKKTHGGDSWLSGVNGAHFGLEMPSHPAKGMRYHQEAAPKVAMDRAEIINVKEVFKTPAGEFSQCVKTEETTPLENGKEYKYYAPKIGLIQDGQLKLSKCGYSES